MLKSGGKIIFISYAEGADDEGQAVHLAGLAGLIKEKRFPAGEQHFGIVFKKTVNVRYL